MRLWLAWPWPCSPALSLAHLLAGNRVAPKLLCGCQLVADPGKVGSRLTLKRQSRRQGALPIPDWRHLRTRSNEA